MNIIIRCDIGQEHGLGHAVRCRALAHSLAMHGASVCFVTMTPALVAFVAPFQCEVLVQDSVFQSLARTPWGFEPFTFVIDTKALAVQNEQQIRRFRDNMAADDKVVRIDHPHATPTSCDLLIGPCNHWEPGTVARLRASFGARFLYGWDYVMLAPEVTQYVPIPYWERKQGPIVFCAGGSDQSGALLKMWQWADDLVLDVPLVFCFGSMATEEVSGWDALPKVYSEKRRHTEAYGQACHIYAHHWLKPFQHEDLRNAALVIGMFGVTCYEAVWYQTPMLCYAHTSENMEGSFQLQRQSFSIFAKGMMEAETPEAFCRGITLLWEHPSYRPNVSAADAGLMDGRGVERVAEAILGLV